MSIKELHQKLLAKEISSVDLTKQYLVKIKALNPKLNAFLTVSEEEALAQAVLADKIFAAGKATFLTGIPYALKDIFCTAGVRTTGASKILEQYIPPYSATVYEKLKAQGAVLLGKTNCDEFAMGASNENSAYGPVKNPLDHTRVAGGSSGGSAAAVAADLCVFALGTDTGGSIRDPASFCGITGLKVTYGRVSRSGVLSLASSLDTIGPLTKSVEDAALVLAAIAGKDDFDSTTPAIEVEDYAQLLVKDIKGMSIGLPKEYYIGLDPELKTQIDGQLEKLKEMGVQIKEVSLPLTEYAIPIYYIILPAEASSNLARYDGVNFGLNKPGKDLLEMYLATRGAGFGDEVKRRMILGTFVLSSGYQEAYYKQAQKVRTLMCEEFNQIFNEVDALITPTMPAPAFKLGEKMSNPLDMYLADIFTAPANLAGIPALSLPVLKKQGLPVGLQIIGPRFSEARILQIAKKLEVAE